MINYLKRAFGRWSLTARLPDVSELYIDIVERYELKSALRSLPMSCFT